MSWMLYTAKFNKTLGRQPDHIVQIHRCFKDGLRPQCKASALTCHQVCHTDILAQDWASGRLPANQVDGWSLF
jgi:hypothetical protein